MKFRYIVFILFTPCLIFAQTGFDDFLNTIETNNKSINAAQKLAEAEQLEAQTGIYLANPEISYDYLNGNSESYSEMVISQSFDFPTTYIHKSKIADISTEQSKNEYRQLKISILANVSSYYAEQIITNRKLVLMYELENMLNKLLANTERKLELGEVNILETNRVRTESAKNMVEVNMLKTSLNSLNIKIAELNGGNKYELSDSTLPLVVLSISTDSILNLVMNNHPVNHYWINELMRTERDVQLQKSTSLPKFELGYRQDRSSGRTFNGISAGISIPLFENKNTVKLAKAQHIYAQEEFASNQNELENELKIMVSEYINLKNTLQEIEQMIGILNTPSLLLKSYEAGQIGYTEFFSEYSNYKETQMYIEDLRLKTLAIEMQLYVLENF